MNLSLVITLVLLIEISLCAPWEPYILAPESRIVKPKSVYETKGTVKDAQNILVGKPTSLMGALSMIVLDFGVNIGGLLSLHFTTDCDDDQILVCDT